MTTITAVVNFWFNEVGPEQWFIKEESIDAAIASRFGSAYAQAAAGLFDEWRHDPRGCLALLILLDQFPRNMFRDSSRAFATDAKARSISGQAVANGLDRAASELERQIFYMPLQHSESADDQARCLRLAERNLPNLKFGEYAARHSSIIDRFGRFPHRNRVLGRTSSDVEEAFLKKPGSSF